MNISINRAMREYQLSVSWEYAEECRFFWMVYDLVRVLFDLDIQDCVFRCEELYIHQFIRCVRVNGFGVMYDVTLNSKLLSMPRQTAALLYTAKLTPGEAQTPRGAQPPMLSSAVQSEAAAPYHLHAMADADVIGMAGVQGQGPYLQVFARVDANVVQEASYQTYSCPNAIACGSWVTRWMEGRGPEILNKLTADDLTRVLGGVPLGKEHCATLTIAALQDLLAKWKGLLSSAPQPPIL